MMQSPEVFGDGTYEKGRARAGYKYFKNRSYFLSGASIQTLSPIDTAPVADIDYQYDQPLILNRVNDR